MVLTSAQEIVVMKIVKKLKAAVQDNKVLDDHTADHKPDQRGREDTSMIHPDPYDEGVHDQLATPQVAAAMAHPQYPVPSFHLASSLSKHAAKEDERVAQDEDQQEAPTPSDAFTDISSILRLWFIMFPGPFMETRNKASSHSVQTDFSAHMACSEH